MARVYKPIGPEANKKLTPVKAVKTETGKAETAKPEDKKKDGGGE